METKVTKPRPKASLTRPLTPMQSAFITHYIANGWNGTAAARSAGYGGSDKVLGVQAVRVLRDSRVQAALSKRLRELHLSAEQVLQRLSEMAQGNVTNFLDEEGKINWANVRRKGYLVKRVHHGKGGTELELYDAQAALIQVGKHLGLFNDATKVEVQTGPMNINLALAQFDGMGPDDLREMLGRVRKLKDAPAHMNGNSNGNGNGHSIIDIPAVNGDKHDPH